MDQSSRDTNKLLVVLLQCGYLLNFLVQRHNGPIPPGHFTALDTSFER